MLLSVVVYSGMAIVLFALAWHLKVREETQMAAGDGGEVAWWRSCELHLSVLLIAIIAGARYHTGFDHAAYLADYHFVGVSGDFLRHDYEWGFEAITRLFSALHIHFFFYFAFWAALQFGMLYYGLRHHKFLIPWFAAYLFLGPYFIHAMNTMRQAVVECAFVAMVPLIIERRFWVYLCCALLASTIHIAGLLLIPLYLIGDVRIKQFLPKFLKNRYTLLVILLLCVLAGLRPIWMRYVADGFSKIVQHTTFSHYSLTIDAFQNGEFRHMAWGPSRISNLLLAIIAIFSYPLIRRWRKNDTFFIVAFTFCFIGLCFKNLLVNTAVFVLRPFELLTVFFPIIIAYVFSYYYKHRIIIPLLIVGLLSYTYIFIEIYKAVYRPTKEIVPTLYHVFF